MKTEVTKSIRASVIRVGDLRKLMDNLLDAPDDAIVRVEDNKDRSPGNHECRIEVTYEVGTYEVG